VDRSLKYAWLPELTGEAELAALVRENRVGGRPAAVKAVTRLPPSEASV
jgi:hypothetical protein